MKAVILAGGFGTRLSEETAFRPKPMVEIGGKPILWHIMNIYAAQGINEFIITLGYKAEIIKEYFLHFYAINNDLTVDLATGEPSSMGTINSHGPCTWLTRDCTPKQGAFEARGEVARGRRDLHVYLR